MYKITNDDTKLKRHLKGERFTVTYQITGEEIDALTIAKDILLEQTVEFPEALVPRGEILYSIVGTLETFKKASEALEKEMYLASISYATELVNCDLTSLLNVIFGNISIKPNIKVDSITLPPRMLSLFKGPRYGMVGLRDMLNIPKRPLICTALKPMGLSSKELSNLAHQFALGKIDIIKDDHGISNQPFSPFLERVRMCVDAINEANSKTGGNSIYCANITAPFDQILKRARKAKELGAGALMICPGITGFDIMRKISEDDKIDLPIFSHPSFYGSYVINDFGLSHRALFGQINRLAGADGVIFPNFGGRFSFSKSQCESIVQGTSEDMGNIKSAFPMPGGGMNAGNIKEMTKTYKHDVIYLMGGGLFAVGENLVDNCKVIFEEILSNTQV